MGLDPATGTLLGAIVGATTGVVGNIVTSWYSLRRDREARQDQSFEEANKWQRDQVASMLSESMKRVSIYITMALDRKLEQLQSDPSSRDANAELQRVLVGLIMAYPNKRSPEYLELVKAVDQSLWKGVPQVSDVWPLRQLIVKLATNIGPQLRTTPRSLN
jgi:hypothetical protein